MSYISRIISPSLVSNNSSISIAHKKIIMFSYYRENEPFTFMIFKEIPITLIYFQIFDKFILFLYKKWLFIKFFVISKKKRFIDIK